ncbi:hypothetical protein EVAR_93888_1 [Eumeta japonica]|uniref:Uncharacterized protein n=1 Tax=Eumeta variegata TaxID=151549 RepID=A0A4C1TWQ4_EUMVA|nr:hypothetical protein EVAR_93888_1 [Eumeta japonica]
MVKYHTLAEYGRKVAAAAHTFPPVSESNGGLLYFPSPHTSPSPNTLPSPHFHLLLTSSSLHQMYHSHPRDCSLTAHTHSYGSTHAGPLIAHGPKKQSPYMVMYADRRAECSDDVIGGQSQGLPSHLCAKAPRSALDVIGHSEIRRGT